MLRKLIISLPLFVTLAAVLLSVLITTEVYAQTAPTTTQDDIDGDGMPNKSDQNDDNDGQADWLDDDDDNDSIPDSVDPILNTPEQRAGTPPPTTTTSSPTTPRTPPATAQQPQQPENMPSYCALEHVVCEGEAMPSSRTTNMTNTTATQAAVTTQDPDYERFIQTASECGSSAAFGSSGATMTQEQCTQFLEQGQEKWCGLADYDAQKCAQTTKLTAAWNNLVNLSERYDFSDIPSLGELGIDPRTIAPSP